MDMLWWHWAVLGLVLALLELASPGGFFIIFFGVGALLVSLLTFFGFGGPAWLQWLLFTIFSIVSLTVFRDPLLRRIRVSDRGKRVDDLTHDICMAIDDIAPGEVGRVELRGSAWKARNVGTAAIAKGLRCSVRKVDGLLLHITVEGA
jgi:membrane protein implicated in regulation of membrane protease activity